MPTDSEQIKNFINNPAEHFTTPADVLGHTDLSTDDKQRILESWKVDEQELAKATEENMGQSDTTLLVDVVAALESLASKD
ncbi:MAG: hypothetical protein ACE37N_06770 [Pseudohongiellaceae bacterium]|jgi:hypothetical protein